MTESAKPSATATPPKVPAVNRRPERPPRKDGPLGAAYTGIGEFFLFVWSVIRAVPRRPFQSREFIDQAWFIAKVAILPTALVAIPFGAIIALQVGSLIQQLGAQSLSGGATVNGLVREVGPLATAMLLAGAAGSAICADLGARTIREEIDALKVLGIDPIPRLVVPRVLGGALVGLALTGMVIAVSIAGGYTFNVILQGGTPGVYVDSFKSLATVPDVISSLIKGVIFGVLAALVGCFKGLRAGGGPRGVGQAVNEAVVVSFLLLFFVNFLITGVYFQIYPPGGG
ncbi:MlaE family ABC transporter permease [Nocardioides limicola]|uniref:MlaE family ABC transporter permease n=1 Tax=Nocardioides limicola TaxID=2803368 RepID=UPI00193BDB5D|nr:ABC transporter permease [Nocardioides sp. DJM-14]